MSWYSYLYIIFLFMAAVSCDNNEKMLHNREVNEGRKKDKGSSYMTILTMVIGAVLLKSVLIPLAIKSLAIMATVSVLMSTTSFVISALLGHVKLQLRVKDYHVKDYNEDQYYASSANNQNTYQNTTSNISQHQPQYYNANTPSPNDYYSTY